MHKFHDPTLATMAEAAQATGATMAEPFQGGSVQVCALRIAVLQGDGVPLPGALNLYVTDGIMKFTATPVFTKGADMEVLNGCGAPVVLYKDMDRFKRFDLALDLIYLDPELDNMLVGGELFNQAGLNVGNSSPAVAAYAGAYSGVSLEMWSKHIVNGDQDPVYPWIQWVVPRARFMVAAVTLDNNPVPRNYSGYTSSNPNYYDGPMNDWKFLSDRQMMYRFTTTIPTPVSGAQPLVHS